MSALLLDSSVWLAALDADDRFHKSARTLVRSPSLPLAALDLTLYEVVNVAVVSWRAPARARSLAALVVACCGERLARVDVEAMEAAAALAAERGITVYDAAYVVHANASGWKLVSGDLADLVARGLAVTPDQAA